MYDKSGKHTTQRPSYGIHSYLKKSRKYMPPLSLYTCNYSPALCKNIINIVNVESTENFSFLKNILIIFCWHLMKMLTLFYFTTSDV